MAVIIGIIICYVFYKLPEWKFDNRTSSDGYRTDWDAMTNDFVSGKSKSEVMRKSFRNGNISSRNKYDTESHRYDRNRLEIIALWRVYE